MRTLRRIIALIIGTISSLLLLHDSLVAAGHTPATATEPHPAMILPFVILLLAIAIMPFLFREWWEKYYPHVSIGLGLVTTGYYILFLSNPMRMLHSGTEYFSFICLIGSLFIVAGGMHFTIGGFASPIKNTLILLAGALLSNFVGTTGASMLLIRPFIRNNRHRLHAYHVVFFIFVVSNMGGALTPIGDPPLFLGYLRGIPFFWVMENVWFIWAVSLAAILVLFVLTDWFYYTKLSKRIREQEGHVPDTVKFQGAHNLAFLGVILLAVFIQDPPYLREAIMVLAAIGSYFTTKKQVHASNDFSFHPIKEVGFLFLGLFATMVPALDWLELHAGSIGMTTPGQFYWGTGALSSFLDNAPTYLNFLTAAIGLLVRPELAAQVQQAVSAGLHTALPAVPGDVAQTTAVLRHYHGDLLATGPVPMHVIQASYLMAVHPLYIKAVSIGAVFFGAMSYIGNAPNFMVKSIAERGGIPMPSFFGYMTRFSIPILLPIFALVWFLFFRT